MLSPPHIENATAQVIRSFASRAFAILIRNPPLDTRYPETSDIDYIVVADIEDIRSQRLNITDLHGARTMVDLTWIPRASISDPKIAATHGWIPHRLLSSSVVWDAGSDFALHCRKIERHMYDAEIQQKRAGIFLDTAFETVREVGITWDFPALALFWLHMGHAACLAAALDAMRLLCPNVFTRPFDYLREAEPRIQPGLRRRWMEALRLDADPMQLIPSLRRMHAVIASRFPEPEWLPEIRQGTRFEYRYWLSPQELDWRIRVASEMIRCGDSAAAVFYLRFCAYAIARIPIVHACSAQGVNVSFLRPEKAVLPELRRLIPEIVEDLGLVLAGSGEIDASAIREALSMLVDLRDNTLALLRACGSPVPEMKPWEPYQPQAA